MINLEDEFSTACCNVYGDGLQTIFAAGVPEAVLQPLPMFGMVSIETHGTVYEPAGCGPASGGAEDAGAADPGRAVIVPCGTWDGLNWQLDDLVAFKVDDPIRWWRRLGVADVLGDAQGFTVEPKILVATPLDWLRIAGNGICLLDWSRDPVDVLMSAGSIAATESLKNKVYAAAARAAVHDARNLFHA